MNPLYFLSDEYDRLRKAYTSLDTKLQTAIDLIGSYLDQVSDGNSVRIKSIRKLAEEQHVDVKTSEILLDTLKNRVEKQLEKEKSESYERLSREIAQIQSDSEYKSAEAKAEYDTIISRLTIQKERAKQGSLEADKTFEQKVEAFEKEDEAARRAWSHASWEKWKPFTKTAYPSIFRIGQYEIPNYSKINVFPCFVPIFSFSGLFFEPEAEQRFAQIEAVESILLRALAAMKPGDLRFLFIDPIGRGDNAATFMYLGDDNRHLIHERAWTEPRDIDSKLSDISKQIDNIFQNILRRDYNNLMEYNEANPFSAVPLTFVVVFDFPKGFTEESASRLLSICKIGPRCGVFPIIVTNDQIKVKFQIDLDSFRKSCFSFRSIKRESTNAKAVESDLLPWPLLLEKLPDKSMAKNIVLAVGEESKTRSGGIVPFSSIMPKTEEWWKKNNVNGISMPLGPRGGSQIQFFEVGNPSRESEMHALIVGQTGSGKTCLLHTLITSAALAYSPEHLEMYLIDFKKVEFKIYANWHLPHAKVIAIESDREFGVSVFEHLSNIMHERYNLFRSESCKHINTYTEKTKNIIPRILVIVDEFQVLFETEDNLSRNAKAYIRNLVLQGRAAGIHVVLASQTLRSVGEPLDRSTLDNMTVRIALKCLETDAHLVLGDDISAIKLLRHPGHCLYNRTGGILAENLLFRSAYLEKSAHENILKELTTFNENSGIRKDGQIIFEGNMPGELSSDPSIEKFLAGSKTNFNSKYIKLNFGESTRINMRTSISLKRLPASNILLCGNDDRTLAGMLVSGILTMIAGKNNGDVQVRLVNLSPDDDYVSNIFNTLSTVSPDICNISVEDFSKHLLYLHDTISKEQSNSEINRLLFVVWGAHRTKSIRIVSDNVEQKKEPLFGLSNRSTKPNSAIDRLSYIIKEGPEYGINALLHFPNPRLFSMDFGSSPERWFDHRILHNLPIDDIRRMTGSGVQIDPTRPRAIYYNNETGSTEIFRPYSEPSQEILDKIKSTIHKASSKG